MTTTQINDNRQHKRYNISWDVDAVIDGKVIQSTARDISSNGIFINTPVELHAGKDACVVLSLPRDNGIKPVKLHGKSIRTEPNGVAIEFQGLSPYFKDFFEKSISELLLLSGGLS
ncbi:MAG TPA: hypothetical protein DHV36_09435 [Desulfobacteraceae bacterium]|nr:hypothetical protein [Desulfobacteraceae bacterium]|tara:strand:- start:107 stop:454 length:348 start_codon:yes stop_codon:yes gene_type:complete